MLERYWGWTIKMAGQTYVELTSFHKYIKNASPCGTVLTGNPLSPSRGLQTSERARKVSM